MWLGIGIYQEVQDMSSLPAPILKSSPKNFTLGEIIDSYDPETYENATTKYRKPPYQRSLKKPAVWCISLMNSILSGKSIGAIHLSKWFKQFMDEDGHPAVEEYYNMEDGCTRMDACRRFRDGEFESEWGPYTAPEIARRFDCYQVAAVLIEKAHSRTKDSIYFNALNDNFIDLQEGTALTADDRYAAQIESPDHHKFQGAELVNTTIKVANVFAEQLKSFCNVPSLSRDNQKFRKKLAYLVGLVSGAMDINLANTSYFSHVPQLYKDISEETVQDMTDKLNKVFGVLTRAIELMPKVKNERIANYSNLPKFIGPMLADLHEHSTESVETFEHRWTSCINDTRRAVRKNDKEWLRVNVYKDLGDGPVRNCKKDDLTSKMNAVRNYYNSVEI